ncbi:MAG: tetratricopeptide repeat protein [Bacteroidales bacterium]|nr:tetratricopeptide repeat protein [Bacteroidales bacterium]MBN2757474.1 tetratricopeptide repeat protein [Bacteroidales bacterium]
MNKIILLIFTLLIGLNSFSQKERKYIREGNEEYISKNYDNSELAYEKALAKNPKSFEAKFNLGDAFYKQKKYKAAIDEYNSLLKDESDKIKLSKLYHNIGNCELKQTEEMLQQQKLNDAIKQIDKGINSYKQALKNNPKDRETKYNLAYAQQVKKQLENKKNKQNQQNQNDKNKDNKDNQNQDNQNNQENQDNQNQKSENDSDGDGIPDDVEKGQDKNKPRDTDNDGTPDHQDQDSDNDGKSDSEEAGKNPEKPQDTDKDGTPDYRDLDSNNDGKPDSEEKASENKQNINQISKEDAMRLLEAIENDDKNVQDKLKKIKANVKSVKTEKDW